MMHCFSSLSLRGAGLGLFALLAATSPGLSGCGEDRQEFRTSDHGLPFPDRDTGGRHDSDTAPYTPNCQHSSSA